MGITESVIEEIKARTDLADLIASYGIQVRHAGSSMKACCPFHNEKTPSFNINVNRGFYHCFGCGESGDAIKFVQKMEGLTFVEAAKKLAQACGVKIEEREDPEAGKRKRLYALMAELAAFYRRCLLQTKEAEPARAYLASRALDGDVAEDWTIGYAPAGCAVMLKWAAKYGYTPEELEAAGVIKAPTGPGDRGYHRFSGRLMFTIRDRQGRVVAFSGRQLVADKHSGKYVNSPETLVFKKSNVLFGFDKAAANIAKSEHREVLVCEGQIDTIRLHVSGFPVAVASQGTAFTEEHVRMVKKVADAVLLVFDDDAAGHKATIRTARLFLAAEMPVRVVSLPGGDDPDSFLRTKGAAEFRKLLDAAESIVNFQCRVEKAKEANPGSIDAVARISKAVLVTLAACPSAILKASLVNEAARLLGLPVAALTEELAKTKAEPVRAPTPRPAAPEAASPRPEAGAESAFEEAGEEETFADESGDAPEPVRSVPPPTAREFAFMAFLMGNEYEKTLEGAVGEFLPERIFSHDFVRRFVTVWREEVAAGEDRFAAFAEGLDASERAWLDRILLDGGKSQASALSVTDILQEFVRALWCDHLRRLRGDLPADGGADSDMLRMKISMDLKRFLQVRWNTVKEMIRDWTGNRN